MSLLACSSSRWLRPPFSPAQTAPHSHDYSKPQAESHPKPWRPHSRSPPCNPRNLFCSSRSSPEKDWPRSLSNHPPPNRLALLRIERRLRESAYPRLVSIGRLVLRGPGDVSGSTRSGGVLRTWGWGLIGLCPSSPAGEVTIAPPSWAIGWDVFCWIGHRRCSHHMSMRIQGHSPPRICYRIAQPENHPANVRQCTGASS